MTLLQANANEWKVPKNTGGKKKFDACVKRTGWFLFIGGTPWHYGVSLSLNDTNNRFVKDAHDIAKKLCEFAHLKGQKTYKELREHVNMTVKERLKIFIGYRKFRKEVVERELLPTILPSA